MRPTDLVRAFALIIAIFLHRRLSGAAPTSMRPEQLDYNLDPGERYLDFMRALDRKSRNHVAEIVFDPDRSRERVVADLKGFA